MVPIPLFPKMLKTPSVTSVQAKLQSIMQPAIENHFSLVLVSVPILKITNLRKTARVELIIKMSWDR